MDQEDDRLMSENELAQELMQALLNMMRASDDLLKALSEETEVIAHNPRVMMAVMGMVSAKMELGAVSARAIDKGLG